jgi:hypothetical protein
MNQAFMDSSIYLGVENAFISGMTTLEAHVERNHWYVSMRKNVFA